MSLSAPSLGMRKNSVKHHFFNVPLFVTSNDSNDTPIIHGLIRDLIRKGKCEPKNIVLNYSL